MTPSKKPITLLTLLVLLAVLTTAPLAAQSTERRDTILTVIDGDTALKQLQDGNARFVLGEEINPDRDKAARTNTAASQRPMAIVLSCADSRVAPEILFDAGVGDLFVIRLAGNTLTKEGQASMEYAIAVLQCKLIVVLGHEQCGAVDAGLQAYRDGASFPGTIDTLLDRIEPAVAITDANGELTLEHAIDQNVHYAVQETKLAGVIISKAIASGDVKIVGGVYHLKNGKVEWLE